MTRPDCKCWMVASPYSYDGGNLGREIWIYEEETGDIYLWQEFIFKFCPICNKPAKSNL